MNQWHPRSWVALLMGVIVLVFVLFTGLSRLFGTGTTDPAELKDIVTGWKELMLAIVGGLMVWIGGHKREGD